MSAFSAVWFRDVLKLKREPSRWLGVVAQPFLFWLMIGSGFAQSFRNTADAMDYRQYFYPGALVMTVLFTTIFASMTIIEDKNAGFLKAVLIAPHSKIMMILGKIAGVTTLALVQSALFLLLSPLAHYSYFNISWGLCLIVLILGCIALSGINLAAAWFLDSTQAYHGLMSLILLPLWIVSGALFPLENTWMDILKFVNPISYFVDCLQFAMGHHRSIVYEDVLYSFAGLGFFALLGLAICFVVMRKVRVNIA